MDRSHDLDFIFIRLVLDSWHSNLRPTGDNRAAELHMADYLWLRNVFLCAERLDRVGVLHVRALVGLRVHQVVLVQLAVLARLAQHSHPNNKLCCHATTYVARFAQPQLRRCSIERMNY